MKTEFLEGLGLEKDVIDKIMAENSKDINAARKAGEPDLQKELTTAKEELKQTKEQLKTANATIDGFKDYDEIKEQVADDKAKYEQAEAFWSNQFFKFPQM
jgi:chromosome segregation ATPase